MNFVVGISIAIVSLIAAIIHLEQSPLSYYDFVALVTVIGGTFAVTVITLPWEMKNEIKTRLKELVKRKAFSRRQLIQDCLTFNKRVGNGVYKEVSDSTLLPYQILRDGMELIQLGVESEKIEVILKERLYQSTERARYIANVIRGLSKYPPAFGLAGTVLGLVHLMRGVSAGMSAQETGVRMAIALVATFYGLLVANLVINPIGDAIYKNSYDDEKLGEIALQAVSLAVERTNLLEAQELLNSYVEPLDRVGLMQLSGVEEAA